MYQRVNINVFQFDIVLEQTVDQLVGNGHAVIHGFRHAVIAHAQRHHFEIRARQYGHQNIIAIFFQGDRIDYGGALVNGQGRFDGFGIRAVNGAYGIDLFLHGFYQPCEIFRFFSHEDAGIYINIIGARFKFISGNFFNCRCILILNVCTNGLAAGVDELTNNNHCPLLFLLHLVFKPETYALRFFRSCHTLPSFI